MHHDEFLKHLLFAIHDCPLKRRARIIWMIIFAPCENWDELQRDLLRSLRSQIQELRSMKQDRGVCASEQVDAGIYRQSGGQDESSISQPSQAKNSNDIIQIRRSINTRNSIVILLIKINLNSYTQSKDHAPLVPHLLS